MYPGIQKALEAADAAGLLNGMTVEANGKVLAWTSYALDPKFEASQLKSSDGVYYDVMAGLSYGDYDVEEAAEILVEGINGPSWLADPNYSLFVICLLRVWQFGSAMVIFLAALKGVPKDLYEAAEIDGAGKWRQFFSVTVPIITPVIFYNLVTQLCQAFQEFNGPYIITQGGPRNSTTRNPFARCKKSTSG